MALAQRLIERMFRPRHDYLPGTTIFREIDTDLIARELQLEDRGERDGQSDLPPSGASALSATETAIARRVRRYWDDAAQGARRAHESLSGRWTGLTSEAEIDTLLGEPNAVRSALGDIAREARDQLDGAYQDCLEHRRHLSEFREKERLTRPAQRPKPMAIKLAILAAAFALELMINISAFSSGEEFGLAGALLKVIAIPFLNIGATALLVFFFGRQIVRRPAWARIVGILGFSAAFTWALFFNLTISHWRDSLGTQMSIEAGQTAFAAMMRNPFGLADLNSWLLFAAGFAAGVLGGYDGWIWEDPYPGLWRRTEALRAAETAYNERRRWYIARLGRMSSAATTALRDAQVKAETASRRRPELANHITALSEDLDRYRDHLQSVADDLAVRYREANQRSRATPPPAHFQDPLALNLPAVTMSTLPLTDEGRAIPGLLNNAMELITTAKDEACAGLRTLVERGWIPE